jgi:maleylacetate reductase
VEPFDYDALPGRVIFGVGRRSEVGEEVDRLHATRVLLIADAHDEVTIDQVVTALGERCVGVFTEVAQHVPILLAQKVRALATSSGANATVSLGGGSATGFGKAVSLTHELPQVCIPTTYAGSELTPIWGTSNGEIKETGRDLRVLPRTVIYDPELTLGLPISIAGPSAMNALAHAVEGLYGPGANPVMSAIALESVRVLSTHLPLMKASPTSIDERSQVLYGAYLAGAVLAVVGTALHHKTCHVLGGLYGLDHGKMNAVVLPHALAFNASAIPEAYQRLSSVLGGDAAGQLYDLARALDTPSSLLELGMPIEGVQRAAPLIVQASTTNVRSINETQAIEFLSNCVEGVRPS